MYIRFLKQVFFYFYKELLPFEHKITTYFENDSWEVKKNHACVQQANQKIMPYIYNWSQVLERIWSFFFIKDQGLIFMDFRRHLEIQKGEREKERKFIELAFSFQLSTPNLSLLIGIKNNHWAHICLDLAYKLIS